MAETPSKADFTKVDPQAPQPVAAPVGFNGAEEPIDLEQLIRAQGVQPIRCIEDLAGDFWPEDESLDEFLAWLDRERGRQGAAAPQL